MTQSTPARTGARSGSAAPADAVPQRRPHRALVPVLAFSGITVAVTQTLVVPLVKDLPALLHTTPSDATWATTASLLAGAVFTPIAGRLGDLFGKRRMLLASLAFMVIGSLVCALSDSLLPMVVGRVVQGFAMGAIPLGIAVMRDELPPERLGASMAVMSSSMGVGGGLALPASAATAQSLGHHVLFFAAAGIGALALAMVVLVVRETPYRAPGRFDVPGAVGLTIGLVCLLLPITKGHDWGWGSPVTLGLFGAAAVVLVLWGVMELRVADPLVDLRATARRQVLLTDLIGITLGFGYYTVALALPQLLQLPESTGHGLGQPMVVAGLCMAPQGIFMMVISPVYARLSATRGTRTALITGLGVMFVGYVAGLALLDAVWQVLIVVVVMGIGVGMAYSSLPALINQAVDESETGAANGLNTLMRSVGSSTSSAIIGMVLASMTQRSGGLTVTSLAGFRTAFLIAGAVVLVGVVLALLLPKRGTGAVAAASTATMVASGTVTSSGARTEERTAVQP